MKFYCPHCGQKVSADESWIGDPANCPGCHRTFVVQAPNRAAAAPVPPPATQERSAAPMPLRPPVAPVFSDGPPPARKGEGFGNFLLVLVILAGGTFGYATFRYNESPQQVWKRFTGSAGMDARPTPALVSAPAVETPPPVSASAPAATPETNLPAEAPAPSQPAEAAMAKDAAAAEAVAAETARPAATEPTPAATAADTPPAPAAAPPFSTSGGLVATTIQGNTQMTDLVRRRVTLSGVAELHLTGSGDPLQGSTLNFVSPDAWLYLDNVPPAEVSSRFLGRMWVNGVPATEGGNLRVALYGTGTVVIPHGLDFGALQVFGLPSASGPAGALRCFVKYGDPQGEPIKTTIRSFRLKRGYMATIAEKENGGGFSRNYVAQDHDVEVNSLPPELDGNVRFVRVFPWHWTAKKGVAGNIWQPLNVGWYYNWNISAASSLEVEYVPIKQNRGWPPLGRQDWMQRGATHLLGYNEPDHKDQSNLTVDAAIEGWPDLLSTGLRVGSPAVSDGGLGWLYEFIKKADAAHLRVDFVAVHYYRAVPPQDAGAAARQFYNFLKDIHERTRRPIWITEWNNGANWTKQPEPTLPQQKEAIREMIKMLDETPFVERYAVYNWVKDSRAMVAKDGSVTPAGEVYRDKKSPESYKQANP